MCSSVAQSGCTPASHSEMGPAQKTRPITRPPERRLLVWSERVDSGRDQRLDGIRGLRLQLGDADVVQRIDELFEEERVALGPPHQKLAQIAHTPGRDQLLEQRRGFVRRESFEPEEATRCGAHPPRPAGGRAAPAARCDQQQRAMHVAARSAPAGRAAALPPSAGLRSRFRRSLGRKVIDEIDGRLVQPVSHRQWVEVTRDVEAESGGRGSRAPKAALLRSPASRSRGSRDAP